MPTTSSHPPAPGPRRPPPPPPVRATAPFPAAPPRSPRTRPRRTRRVLAAVLGVAVLLGSGSYASALTAPGQASFQARTVDWVRDHSGGGVVNALENWWYTRHPPPSSPPLLSALPAAATTPVPAADTALLPALPGPTSLPGEKLWVAGRPGADGTPTSYTTYYQPDAAHPGVVTGVAWVRAGATTGHLVAGTQEPGGGAGVAGAQVPAADVASLVATFNSGWKLRDITGGFRGDGQTANTLQDGQASLVIDQRGAITVGQWGRDVTATDQVTAVRQNLALIVDGGAPVPGLGANTDNRWGSAKNQLQYTWRSGVGVDAGGNLVYVAGDWLTLAALGDALTAAGAVRGMELDIHTGMTFFASWHPTDGATPAPSTLLPTMSGSADRYLSPDQRDFLYLTVAGAPPATTRST